MLEFCKITPIWCQICKLISCEILRFLNLLWSTWLLSPSYGHSNTEHTTTLYLFFSSDIRQKMTTLSLTSSAHKP